MIGKASNELKNKDKFVYPECEWGYRLVGILVFVGAVLFLSLFAITIRDNVVLAQVDKFMNEVYRFSYKHGMDVEDVIVEGNVRTSYDDLIQALNLSENESILGVDIARLQSQIEQLTWVKKCVVKRSFFPNNILVNIEERKVKAIWEFEGRYYPVDEEGNVIEIEDYEPDQNLLLLAGEGAPHNMAELLDVLETDEELYNRIKAAVFVSQRRWNLVFDSLDNGVVVKLPEKDFLKAYQKIALLNKRQGIFKRKLTSFDVRIDKSIKDLINLNKN